MSKKTFTIGHSTRTIDEFIQILKAFDIKTLVDVRSLPGSNKFPHFNQAALDKSLSENGIKYTYAKDLGGRRKPNKDSQNTIWKNKSFRAYADYMETEAFKTALKDLKKISKENATAMMCAEAVWWRCHRSMIADALKAEGWKVFHIMDQKKAMEHPYTKPAKVEDGKLFYGKEPED